MNMPHQQFLPYKIGEKYQVTVLPIGRPIPMDGKYMDMTFHSFMGISDGCLPLLTDFQLDERFVDHLGIGRHAHIDYRFLDEENYNLLDEKPEPFGPSIIWPRHIKYDRIYLKKMELICLRNFNSLPLGTNFTIVNNKELERKYACAAIKNGKCPHRGTPVEAMLLCKGKLVCPAHFLKWDQHTGKAAN